VQKAKGKTAKDSTRHTAGSISESRDRLSRVPIFSLLPFAFCTLPFAFRRFDLE